MTPPDRVAMVNGQDGAEDFAAWEAGGAGAVAVLPWLFGRGGRNNDGDVQTDAPVEDNDKWVQGDMRGVPAPADQPHLATWRPEKVVTAPGQPAEEVVLRTRRRCPSRCRSPNPSPTRTPRRARRSRSAPPPTCSTAGPTSGTGAARTCRGCWMTVSTSERS